MPVSTTRPPVCSSSAQSSAVSSSPAVSHVRTVAAEISVCLDRLADHVVLFRWGDIILVTFGLFAGIGTLLSLSWMGLVLAGQGVPPPVFTRLALLSSVAVVAGSWLLAQLLDWRVVVANPHRTLRRPVFVSWGGLVGVVAVFTLVASRSHVSALLLLDGAARALPLGHALGRFGCLSYGCCFGRPTRGPLAIRYRNPEAKAVRLAGLRSVPLHPAPLYEAVLDVGILAVANGAAFLRAPVGLPFALALVLYGAGRFAIESFRDDRDSAILSSPAVREATRSSFSLSRFACAAMAVTAMVLLPIVLQHATSAPALSWETALDDGAALVPAIIVPSSIVFVGFAVHRRRVGEW